MLKEETSICFDLELFLYYLFEDYGSLRLFCSVFLYFYVGVDSLAAILFIEDYADEDMLVPAASA